VRRVIITILAVAALAATAVSQVGVGFTMALTGDSIITRRISVYTEPAHTRLFDLIRGTDASFTNLEMLFHDYEPYPMNESGGTYMRAEPALLKELLWAGFDLVSMANNHTGDYGADGMRITRKHVAAAGLVHAGVGEDLAQAREAAFLETAFTRQPRKKRRARAPGAEPAPLYDDLRCDTRTPRAAPCDAGGDYGA
jgi:hypothetical protein